LGTTRTRKDSVLFLADACAPALIAAYGISRDGFHHISGDGDWSPPNDASMLPSTFYPKWVWAHQLSNNVLGISKTISQYGLINLTSNAWLTPLYRSLAEYSAVCDAVGWSSRSIQTPGVYFLSICFWTERLLIEQIKINPPCIFWGIEAAQAELIAGLLIPPARLFFGLLVLQKSARNPFSNTVK